MSEKNWALLDLFEQELHHNHFWLLYFLPLILLSTSTEIILHLNVLDVLNDLHYLVFCTENKKKKKNLKWVLGLVLPSCGDLFRSLSSAIFFFYITSQHDFASKSSKIPASLIWNTVEIQLFQVVEDTFAL